MAIDALDEPVASRSWPWAAGGVTSATGVGQSCKPDGAGVHEVGDPATGSPLASSELENFSRTAGRSCPSWGSKGIGKNPPGKKKRVVIPTLNPAAEATRLKVGDGEGYLAQAAMDRSMMAEVLLAESSNAWGLRWA